jgi:hypothetical protein
MCKKYVASVGGFDKVIPFAVFRSENDLSGKSLLVRVINLPLDIISVSVNVNMYGQPSLCRGKRSPVCRIFQRQQRSAAPTAGNLREEPVLNKVELGTIRRIMNKKKPDF